MHAAAAAAMATTTFVDDKFESFLKDWDERKGTVITYDLPPDAPKWRGDALNYFMGCKEPNRSYTIAQRVEDIARTCFKPHIKRIEYFSSDEEEEDEDEYRVEWMRCLLCELEAYDGESIDVATLLHSCPGMLLSSFLRDVFSNKHACVRAKAAELVTSMVRNHPTSQQLIIEANGIQLLLHYFTTGPDATSRTKALGAISSLIRNNKSGYETLRNALRSYTYREVVNIIEFLLPAGTLKS